MAIYVNSKGEKIDVSTMPQRYLENALAKAIRNNDQDTIDILTVELNSRVTNNNN